jgi:hypothetical protein
MIIAARTFDQSSKPALNKGRAFLPRLLPSRVRPGLSYGRLAFLKLKFLKLIFIEDF